MVTVKIDQITSGANNIVLLPPNSIYSGVTNVTTSGTRIILGSSTIIKSIVIKALNTNTGTIYVGNNTVNSTNGFPLLAGEAIPFDISNLNSVYIDSSISGEGVSYLAVN